MQNPTTGKTDMRTWRAVEETKEESNTGKDKQEDEQYLEQRAGRLKSKERGMGTCLSRNATWSLESKQGTLFCFIVKILVLKTDIKSFS
ncbi:hypothetical protein AMECASPLE_008102 [Ameca splendens]|uniref:Uncharacterized protein n=1 Tax=Ameca splendens TaxID=208324 RepID=A0ABV0YBQ2_9TELE